MKRKSSISGLILSIAVLAAVIAGLLLPEYLLKLDKSPAFDLEGYHTVEISSTASTDYAWRLRVIANFYVQGGGRVTYSEITERYTEEQQENIRHQFVSQLGELENIGVLAPGTGEKAARARRIDIAIHYLFDPAEIRGTQCATVTVIDPDDPGMQLIAGIIDLESGKILGVSGYTTAWRDLFELVQTEEVTAQEILENYAGYLGMVEPAGESELSEEPPHSFSSYDLNYFAELRLVALPSDRSSAMQMWIEFMSESFLIHIQS